MSTQQPNDPNQQPSPLPEVPNILQSQLGPRCPYCEEDFKVAVAITPSPGGPLFAFFCGREECRKVINVAIPIATPRPEGRPGQVMIPRTGPMFPGRKQ